MTLDPIQLYDWVAKIGLPGAMALLIWALFTRKLHWHGDFEEMKKIRDERIDELTTERNEFKEMVIGSQRIAAKSLDIASESKTPNTPSKRE